MKFSRVWRVLLALGAVLLAAFWWLPASWVRPALEARLHGLRLQQVQGSLWDGHADEVLGPDGQTLGRLDWQLSRAVIWGELRLGFALEGPDLGLSGRLQSHGGQDQTWDNLRLRGEAQFFARRFGLPDGYLQGTLHADIAHAVLQGAWPLALDGTARWQDGVLTTRAGKLKVGTLRATAKGAEGVVQVQVTDDGSGPLALDGQWLLSPLGWRVQATAHARSGDAAMQQWLRSLGTPDASGVVHIQRSGGVAAVLGTKGKP